jgi:DNA-binding GntR family transcriptional regulator
MQYSRRGEAMQPRPLLSRVNLPTQIYSLLKQRIVGNKVSFGYKLTEFHLAEELGVSRTPIREALNRLVQDGLVTVIPGRGAFVTSFSAEDMIELFDVREALEGMAARLASSKMTEKTLEKIRDHLEAGMAERKRNGYTGYVEADREFHEAITSACGNRHLSQLMASLRERIQMLRHRSVILPGRASKSFQEHLAIIEALSLHDPDPAEQRMRTHIRNVKADLIIAMNEQDIDSNGKSLVQGQPMSQKVE